MSTYRSGSRVKIGLSPLHADLEGSVGTIIAPLVKDGHYLVSVPAVVEPGAKKFDWTIEAHESILSPATDCYDVVSWDECPWKPTEMEA